MKIRREIFGQEIEIELSEQELNQAYQEEKQRLDYEEAKEVLLNWDIGEVLNSCKFPYPGHAYILDEKIEEAENAILDNRELMLSIYEKFIEFKDNLRESSWECFCMASDEILEKWGKKHPDFLEQFKDIAAIAYEKYKEAWVEGRNYSPEFINGLKKEYEELFEEFGEPSCFEEYIDEHGYGGELYVCFDEFLGAEFQDQEYMKELLNPAEYVAYLNYQGIAVPVMDFEELYKSEDIKFLTNSLGEYEDAPPEAAYEWYENCGLGSGSLLYLVELNGQVGMLALNEFDYCTCEGYFDKNRWAMDEFVKIRAQQLSNIDELKGYQVISGLHTGFDDCSEMAVFIPYPAKAEDMKKLYQMIDAKVYDFDNELIKELLEKSKHPTEISKEQANELLDYMDGTFKKHQPKLSQSGFNFLNECGLYYLKEGEKFVAFDYSADYEGFVEEFDSLEECNAWLEHEFEISDIDSWRKKHASSLEGKIQDAAKRTGGHGERDAGVSKGDFSLSI